MMKAAAVLLGVSSAARVARHKAKSDCFSIYDGKMLLEMSSNSIDEMERMGSEISKLGCADLSEASLTFQTICDRAGTSTLLDLFKNQVEVLTKDAGEHFRSSSGPALEFRAGDARASANFFSDWRTLDDLMDRLESVVAASDDIATLETVGKSVEQRDIKAVRVRGRDWKSGSPRVVMTFALHAREWITGMNGVYTVEKVIEQAKKDRDFTNNLEIVMIPMVNPDGLHYSMTTDRMWRKNRRNDQGNCAGVDLNRNWDPDFAGPSSTTDNKCSDVYHGPSAFSEPETQAVKKVIDEANVTVHLDVHSYSEMILAPWSYKVAPHPRRAVMDVLGSAMSEAIRLQSGKVYRYGGSEVLYPASGVAPDYSTSKGAIGMTFELRPGGRFGGGFAPPASEILPTAMETWEAYMMAFRFAKGEVLPTAAPTPAPKEPAICQTDSCSAWYACWLSQCGECLKC